MIWCVVTCACVHGPTLISPGLLCQCRWCWKQLKRSCPPAHELCGVQAKTRSWLNLLVRPRRKLRKRGRALLRWAVKVSDLKEGSRLTLKNILQYGWGGGTPRFHSQEIEKTQVQENSEGNIERDPDAAKRVVAQPTYEALNIRNWGLTLTAPPMTHARAAFGSSVSPSQVMTLMTCVMMTRTKTFPHGKNLQRFLHGKRNRQKIR
jgi:hypothetical protein